MSNLNDTKTGFKDCMAEYELQVNEALLERMSRCSNGGGQSIVYDAMLYSLMAGGKRLRPILALEFCKMFGGSTKDAMPFACAVEMVHTYSLIHDDLPCMDNDDYRRGKPSCHKQFGEANALLAGDGLLTLAFETVADGSAPADAKVKAAAVLAQCAGVLGMVGGQVIDLAYEGKPIDEATLLEMYRLKTGALFVAACKLGAIAAGAADTAVEQAAGFAEALGLAFQIADDILDITSTSEVLGKPVGSDAENQKTTFATLNGVARSADVVKRYTQQAVDILSEFEGHEFLLSLTNYLCNRDH